MPTNPPTITLARHPLATWLAMRKEYLAGEGSLRIIALKHGVPAATVQSRAKHEKWSVARATRFRHLQQQDEAPFAPTPQLPPSSTQIPVPTEIQRIEAQIARLNDLLDIESDARCLDKLTVSLTRLHERRRILLGIPLPGSNRPTRKPSRPQASRDLGAVEAIEVTQDRPHTPTPTPPPHLLG
jgi:transposase-like protein